MLIRAVFLALFFLNGCSRQKEEKLDDLNSVKRYFIQSILEENFEEGPFYLGYDFKTILFSSELVSLFGELRVYDHLPHGWGRYEGKTFCKIGEKFEEIFLDDLFTTFEQKEWLRNYCERDLKYKKELSYFFGKEPLLTRLEQNLIRTFIIDEHFLIIIFQPYSVAGCSDGPVVVKIPYDKLKNNWNDDNPLITTLLKVFVSKKYISSWN